MSLHLQSLRNLSLSHCLNSRNPVVSLNTGRQSLCLLHNGPDTVEELLERHVATKPENASGEEFEELNRRRLTSTRREALSLYRDIIRATRFFMWPDARGVLWRDVLRENARKEFEEARFETDPEVVTRLLIGGREAVQSAIDKLAEKIQKDRPAGDRH